jgi:hypothetical protein
MFSPLRAKVCESQDLRDLGAQRVLTSVQAFQDHGGTACRSEAQ